MTWLCLFAPTNSSTVRRTQEQESDCSQSVETCNRRHRCRRRHQKQCTRHAQWELQRQSLFQPPFLTGVTAEIEHFVDNISAISSGRRIGLGGMRHMETRYLWIQEELRAQRMKLTKVKGTENAAYVATKHVDATTLKKCMVTIGLIHRTRCLPVVHHTT